MLPKRLQSIIEHIPNNVRVADIGSDHAYVPISLVQKGNPTPIATEVLQGPFNQSKHNIKKFGVDVDLRFGDGLDPLNPREVDWVVIAGMSGPTIRSILERSWEKIDSFPMFLFQPMLDVDRFRLFLHNSGFSFVDEWVIKEQGKYYQYIKATRQKIGIPDQLLIAYPSLELELLVKIGPRLLLNKHPITHQFFEDKLNHMEKVFHAIPQGRNQQKRAKLQQEIFQWKQVIKCHAQYSELCN